MFHPPGTPWTRYGHRKTPVSPMPQTTLRRIWSTGRRRSTAPRCERRGGRGCGRCGTWCRAPRAEGVMVRNRQDGAKPPVRERLRSVPSRDAVARLLVGTLLRVRTTVFRSCGTPPPHGSFGGDGRKTISACTCTPTRVPKPRAATGNDSTPPQNPAPISPSCYYHITVLVRRS